MKKIKKGKIAVSITVGVVSFVLMAVMFMQFKVINQTDITSIETMRESELTTELASWKQRYEEAKEKYEDTQTKLEEYKNSAKSSAESQQLINDEWEQANLILGKTDVEGEGIVVTINDATESKATDVAKIKADNLLLIVNSLKQAGAEAISINDQRVINMSDIVYINETFIKVNQQRILTPYVIKAIGISSRLESALLGNGGYAEGLKQLGHDVNIEKLNRITINKYDGEIESKYME